MFPRKEFGAAHLSSTLQALGLFVFKSHDDLSHSNRAGFHPGGGNLQLKKI
jgi:hypothetical protein